jgi:hypothetical protein
MIKNGGLIRLLTSFKAVAGEGLVMSMTQVNQCLGRVASTFIASTVVLSSALAQVYDLEQDYSTNSNPAGVWSYGFKSTLGGTMTVYQHHLYSEQVDGGYFDFWQSQPAFTISSIYHNPSSATVTNNGGQGVYPPGTVWFAAGPTGSDEDFSIIRFTVPALGGGTYRVGAAVESALGPEIASDTDFHVLKNGVVLFGQFLAATNETVYTNDVILAPGDTLEFAVGRGADGNAYASALKIAATLDRISGSATLVIPSGLEDREAAGGSGVIHAMHREQTVYGSSHFPAAPIWIQGLKFRPNVIDGTPGNAFTTTISNLQINLSTTTRSPDNLSSVFATNIGADDTVVFSGSITVSSEFSGPAEGPKAFDISIPLQQPFFYNPSQGNLLLDIRDFSGEATCYIDAENSLSDSASRVVSQTVNAATGLPNTGADVIEIQYSSDVTPNEPPHILSGPTDRTVYVGGSVTFSVQAVGSPPLSYQWLRNEVEIPNATNAVLGLGNVQLSQSGAYRVRVSNSVGTSISDTATLVVIEPPPVPRIAQLSPTTGPIGSEVTITGNNFSPVPGENVVFFGAVRATVISASATSLTATVPLGATYGPINVSVAGASDQSSSSFSVVFPSSGVLDQSFLGPRVDLGAADGPIHIALGDVDSDARPDLVVANFYSASVSVYRNISSSGSLSAGSFAPRVDFPVASSAQRLTLGDLDGDGRLDVAAACAGNDTVSVLRNTSTVGNVSFAARVDFAVGDYPHSIALGDLDGDGRLEIATANYYSDSVSVLQNTATPGAIDSASFAPQAVFPVGDGPHSIAIGDLDADGQLDIAAANLDSVTTSVLRNESTTGNLLFARQDLSGGGNHVAIGDLDGDGRRDLVVGNWRGYNLYLLRNTTSGGVLTFAPREELSVGANTHTVSIGDLDGDGRVDLAVVAEQPSFLKVYQNLSTTGDFNFGSPVEFSAAWNAVGVAVGDLDLDGKPDIAFCNFYSDSLSIYRNRISLFPPVTLPVVSLEGTWKYNQEGVDLGTPWKELDYNDATWPSGNSLFYVEQAPLPGSKNTPLTLGRSTYYFRTHFNLGLTNVAGVMLSGRTVIDDGLVVYLNGIEVLRLRMPPGPIGYTTLANATVGDATLEGPFEIPASALVPGDNVLAVEVHQSSTASSDVVFGLELEAVISDSPVAPIITTHPESRTVASGSHVTLSVAASGTAPLIYQWLHDGNELPAGTNSTLTLSSVQFDDAGNYSVRVSNAYGSVTSAHATLTVTPGPDYDLRNNVSTNSNPNGAWSYGWQNTLGGPLTLFTYPGTAYADNGVRVVYWQKNSYEPATVFHNPSSSTATWDGGQGIYPPGTTWFRGGIEGREDNYSVIRFAIPAGAEGAYRLETAVRSYLDGWLSGDTDFHVLQNGTEIFGEFLAPRSGTGYTNILALMPGDTIDFVAGRGADNRHYASGLKIEASFYAETNPSPPVILAPPVDKTVTEGETAAFHVVAGGSIPLQYQWRFEDLDISGATSSGLVISNAALSNAGGYSVRISNAHGSITSIVAVLIVITNDPNRVALVIPNGLQNIEAAGGSGVFNEPTREQTIYSASHFPTQPIWISELRFRPNIYDGTPGRAFTATLSDVDIRLSTSQRQPDGLSGHFAENTGIDETVVFDGSLTLSSQFSGPPSGPKEFDIVVPLTTPFFYDPAAGNLLLDIRNFSPQASSIIDAENSPSDQASRVVGLDVFASSGHPNTGADVVKVIYAPAGSNEPPHILTHPISRTIYIGSQANLSVAAVGFRPLTFQWVHDGDDVPDGTNSTLTISNAEAADSGVYYVRVSNSGGTVTSAEATVTVIPPPPVPRITQISPTSGAIGSAVTISGENFSAVPSENVVYFGPVRAVVTAASTTSLTATVPQGAAYGPVSVTVAGLTAYSSSAFSATFTSSGVLDGSVLAPRFDLNAPDGPIHVALGDIDGDGKPDVTVANLYASFVSVYRNISVTGSLSAGSFAPRLDFATAPQTQRIALGDVDGDGRLDIVASTIGNNVVSVLRNTSTSGNVAFASRVDFAVGNYPHSIAVGDLDGDGRLDIATANYYSDTVSILRNTGVMGNVDASSFAPQVQFPAGDGPHSIAIGDLDGDGKPEVVAANFDSVTTTVLRNTSGIGDLSFTRSDLSGGGNHVAIGDLDGDGKLDLAVGYWRGYNLFLLRNTSTGGALSFAPRVELSVGANTHTISIGDLDGDGRPDLAVVAEQPSFLKVYQNLSSAGALNFGSPAQFSAGWNAVGVAVGDLDLDGKPDITFCNFYDDTITVYRNRISESGLAPQISSQPQNREVAAGATATFSVQATGTAPLQYQWQFNGATIPNANSSSLIISNVQSSDAGGYSVVVGNNFGSMTSTVATLTIFTAPTAPVIVSHPQSQSVSAGGTALFSVTATGTQPLAYQWRFNGSILPGATRSSLVISNAQPQHNGIYSVQVRNVAGIAISDDARLTVITGGEAPPTITRQPMFQGVTVGATAVFTIEAAGTGPITYQWYYNGAALIGATASSLVISNVQSSMAGTYWATASNPFGVARSAGGVLSVQEGTGGNVIFANRVLGAIDAPVYDIDGVTRLQGVDYLVQLFAGPSAEGLAPMGAAVPFRVGAGAGYIFADVRVITNVPAGQVASIQLRAWESAAGTTFEQAVANGGKHGASSIIQVTADGPPAFPADLIGLQSFALQPGTGEAPEITGQPADTTVLLGENASFTLSATGAGPLYYQWRHDGVDLADGTSPTLSISGAGSDDAGEYVVIVSNSGGAITSAVAVLTVEVERVFALASPPDQNEGSLVSVPLTLTSEGEVAGMNLILRYDPDVLSAVDVTWDAALDGAFKQYSLPHLGELRLIVATSGAGIPAGEQILASINFNARTVPIEAESPLILEVLDVSRGSGEVIQFGTDVVNARARVTGGGAFGDNNGNERLDVGDGTLLERLLAGMDTIRPWDLERNDLNGNDLLDSGDVIKILRAVAGIETQPAAAGIAASPPLASQNSLGLAAAPAQTQEMAVVAPGRIAGTNGQLVRVQIRLENLRSMISGAAFTLAYPTGALRLASYRTGWMVPGNSLPVWNAARPGQLTLAVSSDSAWHNTAGVLAEINFEVLPGAANQHAWAIGLAAVEVTPNGYAPRALASQGALLIGRAAAPGRLSSPRRGSSGEFIFSLTGDPGATYSIQASTDLVNWDTLTSALNATGTIEFTDPDAASFSRRFYRVVPAE